MDNQPKVSPVVMNPCDILVCINDRKDLFSRIKRWVMGRYEHVEMYLGDKFYDIPLLYESDNRGVVIQNVAHQRGRKVRVMRLELTVRKRARLVRTAVRIASDSRSYYDWIGLIRFAALRVLREKIHKNWSLKLYQRDPKMICSEAVAEIFWRNKIDILPKDIVPVPADFAKDSQTLEFVAEGNLLVNLT